MWPIRHARDRAWLQKRIIAGLLLMLSLALTSACDLPPQPFTLRTPTLSPTPTAGPLGKLTRFPLAPGVPGLNRIAVGPDGSLWLTAFNTTSDGALLSSHPIDDAIVHFTPSVPGASSSFTTFPLPVQAVWPDGITLGPDSALWFTEFDGDAVARITTFGRVTEYFVPRRPGRITGATPNSQPHDIVAGPDGNLWFNDFGGNKVGRITPQGVVTEFSLPPRPENPSGSGPYGITVGVDGALWFTELMGMRIGRITTDGRVTEYKLPGVNHVPGEIVAGGDGALWFTESTQNLLGRITLSGHITEYPLPNISRNSCSDSSPLDVCQVESLVAGPDGGIWFTEGWRDGLGRIDASGHITEFTLPQLSKADSGAPQSLALGPNCALWFTYGVGIGRLLPFSSVPGCAAT